MSKICTYYGYTIYVRPERNGCYSYFYLSKYGESVKSLLTFGTKEIAAAQANISIEKTLLWREVSILEKTMS